MAGEVESVEEYRNMGAAETKQTTKGISLPDMAILLVILTFITYAPALHCGFVWDDNSHFLENHAVTASDGLRDIWTSFVLAIYYPLTFTVFWLIYQLEGPNPFPFHVVTLALHAVNAVLLLFLLRRLNIRGALVVAALWAVHPVNVESVAWATELKNTLSGAWFFASLLCFLRYEREPKCKWFVGALLCFAAALLSKSSTVMLPAVLLLFAWWQRGRVVRVDVVRILPFLALSLAASFVAIWAQVREKVSQGVARDWSLQFPERLIVAGKDVWFYVGKTVWPADLIFIYPRWSHDAHALTEWLPLAGAVATGIILWRFKCTGPGRAAIFALGYFVVALSPVLGFFDQYFYRYSFVADHFQYLASISLIALAVAATGRLARERQSQVVLGVTAGAILVVLSWQHCAAFQNSETLWRDTIAKNPKCRMAHNNLGNILLRLGKVQEAIDQYEQVLQVNPNDAEAHANLGNALLQSGKTHEAISHYEAALRIDPDLAEVQNNLGVALLEQGKITEAILHCEQALRIHPNFAGAHYTLGNAFLKEGQVQNAIEQYRQALKFRPNWTLAGNALAQAQASQ
jgi:protein O-mannosyl-transferase